MSKKIKVLQVQLTENFGGIESLLTNVYANIDRSKYQFDFIVTAKKPYQKKLTDLGGNIFLLPSIKQTFSYIKTFNEILNNNYDIVHFHKNSAANIIPILIVKNHSTHPKIIVHSHNTFPSIQNRVLVRLHRINRIFLSRMADKKIACSNAAANWMFGKKDDVQIINNGIDIKRFTFSDIDRRIIRNKYNIKKNDFVVGAVGRFTKQKNYKMTIDIFNEVKKLRKDSKLMIIGDGYLKKALVKQVHQLGLEDDVLFLGLQLNVSPYLSAMDAFLMPSIYEGLGIAAVEAQSEGLPTYISDKFPKEVTLTNLVRRFSIKQSLHSIANTIISGTRRNIRNELTAKKIEKSDYSLNNTVKNFANVYQGILNNEKIKVMHFVSGLGNDGVTQVIKNYTSRLNQSYNIENIIVYQHHADCSKIDELQRIGDKLYEIPYKSKHPFANLYETCKIIKKEKPDIVHAHMSLLSFYPLSVAWLLGVRARIAHAHIAQDNVNPYMARIFKKLNLIFANHYMACGQAAGKYLFGKNKFDIMYNAIDQNRYKFNLEKRERLRQKLKIKDNTIVLGTLGRLTKQKNQGFLIDIFNRFHNDNPNSKLIIVGVGELKEKLSQKIRKINQTENIIIIPGTNDPESYYSAFDYFILPSLYEGLPVSAIEAQASGINMVLSNNIDKDVKYNSNVIFVPIDKGVSSWISAINNFRSTNRKKASKDNMYNIENQYCKIYQLYIEYLK